MPGPQTKQTTRAAVLDTYCSIEDACESLSVSRWTIQRLIADRSITSTRIAGARRISISSLNAYVAANTL